MDKRKKILIIIIILIIILSIIGVSYAVWILNLPQTGQNVISSSCFNVTFTDKDSINLDKTYPLLDEDGKKLTPYEFTITNNCDSYASYNVNLDILNSTTLTNDNAIKIMLASKENGTEKEMSTSLLSSLTSTTKTLSDASKSFNLTTGYLNANESKTYTLRLWIDENITVNTEGIQNTKFSSKVVVTTSYLVPVSGKDVLSYVKANADSSSNDVYTVPGISSDSCTYTLAYDGTSDNNLRYVGANPCNYVTFNGETAGWRIIGVLNTPEGQRVKLIRTDSIGNYSWDNKASGTGSSDNDYGSNDWTDSTLKEVLNNGAYYNRTSGTCPSGSNGATISCDFTSNGLTEEAKNQIDTITWNLGGTSNYSSTNTIQFYTYERGTTVYTDRPTEWQGKVGLMYPSDYGYATSGGSTSNRTSCLNKELYSWDSSSYSDCKNNDWLYNSSIYQWTLAPHSSDSSRVFNVYMPGRVNNNYASNLFGVRPSVYLVSSISIVSGEGTFENPYQIG